MAVIVEENHQQVNAIYFDWIRRYQILAQRHSTMSSTGSFISVEQSFKEKDSLKLALKNDYYATLIQISEQCPLYGGKAVYEARALRTQFEETLRQYPDACIERLLPKTESAKTSASKWDISMYPNPAKETVNLNYVFPKDINATVEIFTSSGSLVLTTQLYSGKGVKELSLNALSEGIYLVSFRLSNGDLITKKLTIQR